MQILQCGGKEWDGLGIGGIFENCGNQHKSWSDSMKNYVNSERLETKGGIECETPIFKMEKLLRDIDLARGRIENVLNLLAKVKDET